MIREDLLSLLAKHLRTVEPETFDINRWKCGTKACAVGHAVNVPEIHAAGLRLVEFADAPYPAQVERPGLSVWGAVGSVFGLTVQQALDLFALEGYVEDVDEPGPTASDVADKIEAFLEELA